ncbi:hypothetical protein [Melissospora conviva]|uniref:hypothetical protein n=1 Tax=Melissospora conviva TaxID=3388432 RepID=UPI003B798293
MQPPEGAGAGTGGGRLVSFGLAGTAAGLGAFVAGFGAAGASCFADGDGDGRRDADLLGVGRALAADDVISGSGEGPLGRTKIGPSSGGVSPPAQPAAVVTSSSAIPNATTVRAGLKPIEYVSLDRSALGGP